MKMWISKCEIWMNKSEMWWVWKRNGLYLTSDNGLLKNMWMNTFRSYNNQDYTYSFEFTDIKY